MPEKVCVRVHQYDELNDNAKEKARQWWLQDGLSYEWWDFVFDDAKEIGKILGIEIKEIYFRGFSSQGDGACFEGSYSYRPGSVKGLKEYAPTDQTLHRIAIKLSKLQRSYFYKLAATVKQSGHYCHEYCTAIDVYDERNGAGWSLGGETADALIDTLRDFMRWIYRRLEKEYDYQVSVEQVAEVLRINGYDFYEDGSPACFPKRSVIERMCNSN